MRISDWSSDVYSSDLLDCPAARQTERCDSPTAHSAASGYVPPDVPVARPGSRHETVGGQHDYCRADHDPVARTAPAPELATGVRWPSRPSVPPIYFSSCQLLQGARALLFPPEYTAWNEPMLTKTTQKP